MRSVLVGAALVSAVVACGRDRSGGDGPARGNGGTNGDRGGAAGQTATSGTGGASPSGGTMSNATGGEAGRAAAPNAGTGGVAGKSGAAGVAGDSTMPMAEGGQGGDAESAGTGAEGGSAGTAAMNGGGAGLANAGAGATAGTPSEVLDPELPVPTHDCRTETENCVSVAGTFDGMSVDVFTNPDQCGGGGVHSGKWAIGCDWLGRASDVHVVLDYPIIQPGSFFGSMGPGDTAIGDFQFSAADATGSVALFAPNLLSAEIAGTVVADGSPSVPYRIVSGTFHGVWGTPDSSCKSASSSSCATAELNVTFRSRTKFGTCLEETECMSPYICDTVGFFCKSP